MCIADQVWITELTLIHKNIRSVRNSHVQELTVILKNIGPIKTITSVLKISTYIITSITAHTVWLLKISTYIITSITAVRLAVILVMSVYIYIHFILY